MGVLREIFGVSSRSCQIRPSPTPKKLADVLLESPQQLNDPTNSCAAFCKRISAWKNAMQGASDIFLVEVLYGAGPQAKKR